MTRDAEATAIVAELADADFPAPWDEAAPVAVVDVDATERLVVVPATPDRAYTDEHLREDRWLRSCEAADDEWTDEPTRADLSF